MEGRGEPAPKDYFTGTVWVKNLVTPEDNVNAVMGKVQFEPNARTNWHSHPYGQILIVTEGVGYYQEKGKPVQIIKTGDVVKIPVAVEHWHGASQSTSLTHTAMVPSSTNGTIWLDPVSDADYNSVSPLKPG